MQKSSVLVDCYAEENYGCMARFFSELGGCPLNSFLTAEFIVDCGYMIRQCIEKLCDPQPPKKKLQPSNNSQTVTAVQQSGTSTFVFPSKCKILM